MLRRSKLQPLVALALVVVLAAACSSRQPRHVWDRKLLAAGKLHDRGELESAERRYRQLLESAPDRQDRRAAQLRLAQLAADRGDRADALERYRAIWEEPDRDSTGARAMWETVELVEDPDERADLRRRLVVRYPQSSWAESTVEIILDNRCDRDCSTLTSVVDELHPEVEGTPVADNLFFEAARILQSESGRTDDAESLYRRQLRHYPDGSMADDAEWELANIYIERQAWSPARHYLRRVADRVEISRFIGSYNSPWAARARFELARIHLLHLDDYSKAVDHFEQLLKDFSTHTLADDAVWHIAQAHRLAGRHRQYLEALHRLSEEYPASRHVERAERRLEEESGR